MNIEFYAKMILNEVEIILKKLKLNHTASIENTKNGTSIIIAFTDINKCDKAYNALNVRYNTTIFGCKVNTIKKADYIVRINIY